MFTEWNVPFWGLNVYDHIPSAPPDHILFSSVPRGNCNLPWMPLFSSPALSPVRWKWREVKTQSASGHPREVFKAARSAGWHWIPEELSPRGLETEGALSRGSGGGVEERGMCDNGYCWVDLSLGCLNSAWPEQLGFISVMFPSFLRTVDYNTYKLYNDLKCRRWVAVNNIEWIT